jgi:hypothetical protein
LGTTNYGRKKKRKKERKEEGNKKKEHSFPLTYCISFTRKTEKLSFPYAGALLAPEAFGKPL